MAKQGNLLSKTLVIGIIFLFIVTYIFPGISGNIEKINSLSAIEEIGLNISDSDLVGWWTFDEGNGNITYDSSGNGNHGNIYGASWTTGISGSALEFNGINDYVDISDTNDFKFANQDLTVMAWVQIADNSNKYRNFISLGDAWPEDDGIPSVVLAKSRQEDNGNLYMQIINEYEDSRVARSTDEGEWLPKDEWLFLTGVIDYPDSLKLYVNAECQETVNSISFNMSIANKLKLWIGASPWKGKSGHAFHNSLIDDVRIYKKALTENEIRYLFDVPGNQKPNKPNRPSGTVNGRPEVEYIYTTKTIDPENDPVYYKWYWGDGNLTDWFGPYDSGLEISANHTWGYGSYYVLVKAQDEHGEEGHWSPPLKVTISKVKSYIFNFNLRGWIIECFPRLEVFLRAMNLLRSS